MRRVSIIVRVGDRDREVEIDRGHEKDRTTPACATIIKHSGTKISDPVQMETGKRDQPSVNAVYDDGLGTHRIFVRDKRTNISFLMDTGADTCVYTRNKVRGPANKSDYELFAANEIRIATYGTITVSLNLSLRRAFKWRFLVADL